MGFLQMPHRREYSSEALTEIHEPAVAKPKKTKQIKAESEVIADVGSDHSGSDAPPE